MNFEDCRKEVSFGGEKIQISIQTTIKEAQKWKFSGLWFIMCTITIQRI